MIIGLTGGTGSGKSTVCSELAKIGCVIIDADAIYKELTQPGTDLVKKLAEVFGNECAKAPEYILDRRVLAAKAFSSKENTALLNSITHTAIGAEIKARIQANRDKNIILDIPLLFESGTDKVCDEIWTVTADIETRIDRVMKRDNISRDEVLARMQHQLSDEERIAGSDLVIVNNTMPDLLNQINTIVKERLD